MIELKENMKRNNSFGNLKIRRLQIIQNIKSTRQLKKNIIEYDKKLKQYYKNGKISNLEYKQSLDKFFKGRTVEQWTKYYDECINFYKKELNQFDYSISKIPILFFLIFLFIVTLVGFGTYTGYVTLTNINDSSSTFFHQSGNNTDVYALSNESEIYTINSEDYVITLDSSETRVNFTYPTPDNNTISPNSSWVFNLTIDTSSLLSNLTWNWNGTNYSFYNDSLILMYNFENSSQLGENSTLVLDLSSNKKNGTGYSGVLINSTSGKYGGGAYFDGSNDYVKVASLTSLSGSELTVAYWFKGSNIGSAVRQQANGGGSYLVFPWNSGNPASNPVHILSNDGGTGAGLKVDLTGGTTVQNGNWHYVVMTWKQNVAVTGFSSYLDGTLIANRTSSNTAISNLATPVEFGRYQGNSEFTKGLIDEVRIYNKSLSADEILRLYQGNLMKYDSIKWQFYFTLGLVPGNYTYSAAVLDILGVSNFTETRTLQVSTGNTNCPSPNDIFTLSTTLVWGNKTMNCDNITINSGGLLILNSTSAGNTTINITTNTMTINSGGEISSTGTGFLGGQGPGNVMTANVGGSHGGEGGGIAPRAYTYDSITYPLQMGSGGENARTSGWGGGAIFLNISGTLTNNGIITSNASNAGATSAGAGGGILINATTLTGSGIITAHGAGTTGTSDSAGGGGRIAIYYVTNTLTGEVNASGGKSASQTILLHGGAGTVYTKSPSQSNGELIITGQTNAKNAWTHLDSSSLKIDSLDNITIYGTANINQTTNITILSPSFFLDSGSVFNQYANFNAPNVNNLTINNATFELSANYTFNNYIVITLNQNAILTSRNNSEKILYFINLTAKNITINSGAIINTLDKGYSAGFGSGKPTTGGASGSSYGGYSGIIGASAPVYGLLTYPNDAGSGSYSYPGGGYIFINVTDTFVLNGTINANASRNVFGTGSGGAVSIFANIIKGNGEIQVEGGYCTYGLGSRGSGSGGRVSIYSINDSQLIGTINTSSGGSASGESVRGARGSEFRCTIVSGVTCNTNGNESLISSSNGVSLITNYSTNASIKITKSINATWTNISVSWDDYSDNSTNMTYTLSGFYPNTNYSIYRASALNKTFNSSATGKYTFSLLGPGTHQITVSNTTNVTSEGGSSPSVIGITLDDSFIEFGSGYYNASCSSGFALINSNQTEDCWINTTSFVPYSDVHLITNNGTAATNVTAKVLIADAEELFCDVSQGCTNTNYASIKLSAYDNEVGSCSGNDIDSSLANSVNNFTAGVCNSLSSSESSNQIKTYVEFQVPKDSAYGRKQLLIVYEAIIA